jgi:tRNA(Ile)-lysidine synthase
MPVRSLPNPWSNTLPLVRPLLGVWREQIDQYLQEHELVALQDPSNQDRTYFRNRLRHELIPYLQSYQPEIKPIMLRTADVFAQEDAFLDEAAAAAWQAALCDQGAGYLGFKRDVLTSQPLALQRRILRRAVYQLRPGLRDLDFVTVDKAVQFLENPPKGRQANLLAGLRFVWEDARLWLAGWETELPAFDQDGVPWPQLPGNAAVTLSLPGSFDLGNGWQLMGYLPDASRTHQAVTSNSDPYQAWLDYDRLSEAGFPLTLRPRLPGDRLQPLGMQGHSIKLSEFMINSKLASRARRLWPLVLAGRKIAWVPGLRLAHPFRVTEDTRQVVHLVLARQSES